MQKRVEEASQQLRKEAEPCSLRTSASSLSREITSQRFPKKLVMLSFEYYSRATDPIKHLQLYQDKMASS